MEKGKFLNKRIFIKVVLIICVRNLQLKTDGQANEQIKAEEK